MSIIIIDTTTYASIYFQAPVLLTLSFTLAITNTSCPRYLNPKRQDIGVHAAAMTVLPAIHIAPLADTLSVILRAAPLMPMAFVIEAFTPEVVRTMTLLEPIALKLEQVIPPDNC